MTPYELYLKSEHWRDTRSRVIERGVCEWCGESTHGCRVNVHHKHYRTIGRERDEDLMLLHRECHESLHFDLDYNQPRRLVDRITTSGTLAQLLPSVVGGLR